MNLKHVRKLQLTVIGVAVALLFVVLSVHPSAQNKTQLPAPTTHVNDLAGILDDQTKQRIENLLENLKQRNKIEFCVAVVQDTSGQDIFDFSRKLAHDWNVGSRITAKKSLLLVVSVNDRVAFTQFSRSVQGDLPDGVLGEMTQRMRVPITAGNFNEAVTTGVDHFVETLARKSGLSLQDFEAAGSVAAVASSPEPSPIPEGSPKATAETTPPTTTVEAAQPEATRARSVKASVRNTRDSGAAVKAESRKRDSPVDDDAEAEEVELTLTLPFEARVTKLKDFLATHPRSKVRAHATELLISAYAALGDQKLRGGDVPGGTELLFLAIDQAPPNMSEKLFTGVIAEIPLNLYLSGERPAAFKAAQNIESRFGDDAKRLLALTAFYLRIESGDEAARLAAQAVKLAPEMAEAHQALAVALHISLRLDEAMAEYKRALELDPSLKTTRRSLADLTRATGKSEDALVLYREQLKLDPADKAARAGMVLALLETGKKEEANSELEAALKDDPRNLPLLTGAAYWFAAHNESERGLELARQAVEIEPRYTWAQIAAARALLARKQPLQAERALRFARQYGRFPTLDYELATVLASAGLYDEAAEVLQQSFALKDGQIETRLGGRKAARDASFLDLLAPERRGSIFQFDAADNAANGNTLKALLALQAALTAADGKVDQTAAVAAAREFTSGTDEMVTYRQLYAASRLLAKGISFDTAYELAEAAKGGVDAAMMVPAVTVAVQADEYRNLRARAIAQGATPEIPEAPRSVLANILRGKIEDTAGWALFNEDKATDAIQHLRTAAATLPEGTPAWRGTLWHLGAALEQTDKKEEALNYYIKSYVSESEPDPLRRQLIEQLYRKINGSLDGLDQRLNGSSAVSAVSTPTADSTPANNAPSVNSEATAAASPQPLASPSETNVASSPSPAKPGATPSPESVATPSPESPATPSPEAAATPSPEKNSTESLKPADDSKQANPEPSPTPAAAATPSQEEELAQAASRLRATIKITGRVKDANDKGMSNVVVVLISPRGTVLVATTDAEGNYSFSISPSQRNYRLVPSRDDLRFEPVDRAVVAFTEDLKGIDFVATRAP
ncbi:MAG TPA: TPM domain-containing protein [Pyrinomonadaceae bacterium]